ncbi:NAD-dependent protein deacetylase [Alicyclobacillus contaminans]|uniref:NAD-dependent protein deacylase n=1 Tax=Alicyclobacillus contaminans TaxID=392016 RepID=UPI00041B2817|nr:NAD-dependent protein deacylase [Alicyclobacillus contaminans]GMA51635.1 NAD-dependent protein deacetylase [Alicyclobacillus contaminans]
MQTQAVGTLRQLIETASDIVVLTGAGMSTESGIPDFRSDNGAWQDETLAEAMSDTYLHEQPHAFWQKFKQVFLREEFLSARPNPGHLALAALEAMGKRVRVFTQNVDGLHQQAGSSYVVELHGSIRRAVCPMCQQRYGLADMLAEPVPTCHWTNVKGAECGFVLHPDTVLFGQPVRQLSEAVLAAAHCDLFLVLGTSLLVDPVAELPNYALAAGHPVAVVNLEDTYIDGRAAAVVRGKIGEVLPLVVAGEG